MLKPITEKNKIISCFYDLFVIINYNNITNSLFRIEAG